MSIDKILKLLNEKIEKSRLLKERVIIFWLDLDKTYEMSIDTLDIDGFKIVKHNSYNQFFLKKLIEVDEANSNFIVYRSEEIMENENWLIDIERYSEYFSPDSISLLIDELEVPKSQQSYIRQYRKFFEALKRKEAFKLLYNKNQNNKELLFNFYAVIFKIKAREQQDILRAFIMKTLQGEDLLSELEKFNLRLTFEIFIKEEYGIDISQTSIEDFIEKLFLCHFDYKLKSSNFKDLSHINKNSAYLLIEALLKDKDFKLTVYPILKKLEENKKIIGIVENLGLGELIKIGTLDFIDRLIISKLILELKASSFEAENLLYLINQRKTESYNFKNFESQYNLIEMALQFRILIKELRLNGNSPVSLFRAYTEEIYKLDSLYRKFFFEYDKLEDREEFFHLQQYMEIEYTNYYNIHLSEAWEDLIANENVFESTLLNLQRNFFEKEVMPFVKRKHKLFVIISDALRYEVGMELAESLSKEATDKVKIETEAMLGALPSITKIGMSALLPQKNLEFNQGNITIDAISTKGTPNRQKVLQNSVPQSLALSYGDVIGKSKEELSELTKGYYCIYIYHDLIDAIGDDFKTEDRAFFAIDEAIKELKKLIFTLNNKANANNIYITSDHGFLYQRNSLKEYNKLNKFDFPIIEQGKRYILSTEDFSDDTLLKFNLKGLFKNENLKGYFPIRNTRIKQQGGGSKFVHGGISLQEVCIPLIKFKYLKGDIEKKQKVSIQKKRFLL